MELEMKKAQRLSDGVHTGQIIDVKYDSEPYEYTRVIVKLDDSELELGYSCPTNLSENSKLMSLLKVFGVNFEDGKKIDPSTVLINQKIQFQIINKPSKKDVNKTYSEIVEGSLKPINK